MTKKRDHSIQFVAKITGINAHTIRAWEKRYQAIVPHRDHNQRRLYGEDHIDRLKKLSDLVNMGSSISDIANLSEEELNGLHLRFRGEEKKKISEAENKNFDIHSTLQNLTLALHHYKLEVISHELDKMKTVLGPRDFALSVLLPLINEVGMQVDAGQLTIAQEHALSAILRFHIGQILYKHYDHKKKKDLTIAMTTPEGELHEFGILIAALLCCHYDINFIYLGTSLPSESLTTAVKQMNCPYVLLGISKASAHKVTQLDAYVESMHKELGERCKIWLGGISKLAEQRQWAQVEFFPTLHLLDQRLAAL
jgi:MerR family transcriptional regulator, light-induced transcriptional regulator